MFWSGTELLFLEQGIKSGEHIMARITLIRHGKTEIPSQEKDDFRIIENNLNKSVLLLAINQLCKEFPENVSYFPSYEILIDELRDYRFYSNDWIHPSEEAKEFIWNKLSDVLLSEKSKKLNLEIHKIRISLAHQPKFGINNEYLSFLNKTHQKIKDIKGKTPNYSWKDEENTINEIIN